MPDGAIFPRLHVELVPSTCWGSNVRSLMRERAWKRLAAEVAEDGGRRCEICKGRGRQHAVECHEVWHYDDHRGVQLLMRLQALCPNCHLVKHFGRSANVRLRTHAYAWLARVNEWDAPATERYVSGVFEQWAARSSRAWTLDLTVLGTAYGVELSDLGLESDVIAPHEREQLQGRHAVRTNGARQRAAVAGSAERPAVSRETKNRRGSGAPRQTKQTGLPKRRRSPVDWAEIAASGRVWEFIEGEDFTGSAANFRARAKTAARRQGVDFNSVQRQRGDKAVLKILAFMMPVERPTEAAIAPAVAAMTQLTLPI